jgi:hypothetical protein
VAVVMVEEVHLIVFLCVKVFAHNKKGKSELVTVAESVLLERPGLQTAGILTTASIR